MTDQAKHKKLENIEDIKETCSPKEKNIENSISENNFNWNFILDREWSRTKK